MSDGEGSASGDLGRRKSLDAAKAGVSVAFKELRESGEVTSESGVEFLRKIEDKVEEAFLQVSDWLSEGGFAAVPFMFRSSLTPVVRLSPLPSYVSFCFWHQS